MTSPEPTLAEQSLAQAWIAVRDDVEDRTRLGALRVAADRLQALGHPLGELVALGMALEEATDPMTRERLRDAHSERATALIPVALGPFGGLITHPRAFDLQWSLCYLHAVRLPLARAHRYAPLLGVPRLDPDGMLEMLLELPAARCLRSLTLHIGYDETLDPVLEVLDECVAPIESIRFNIEYPRLDVPDDPPSFPSLASIARHHEAVNRIRVGVQHMPYLHTLDVDAQLLSLPHDDPAVPWTGDAFSIRKLGRAVASNDSGTREQALARIRGMAGNAARYSKAAKLKPAPFAAPEGGWDDE